MQNLLFGASKRYSFRAVGSHKSLGKLEVLDLMFTPKNVPPIITRE